MPTRPRKVSSLSTESGVYSVISTGRSRSAIASTRNAWRDMSSLRVTMRSRSSSVMGTTLPSSSTLVQRGMVSEGAPLTKAFCPSPSTCTTDMRLRTDSKGSS